MKSRSLLLSLSLMAAGASVLPAQNVKEVVTDEKYANTTIVYKHENSTATDAEILSQLNGSYGMGDVVRIAVAPPKPAPIAVPKIEKPSSPAAVKSVRVSATPAPPKVAVAPSPAAAPSASKPAAKPLPQAVPMVEYSSAYQPSPASTLTASADGLADLAAPRNTATPALPQAARNWVDEVAENGVTQAEQQKSAAAPKQLRTNTGHTAVKSGKKSVKSGGWFDSSSARKKSTPTKKNKKRGGQKYGCFKF
ncbi:MAG TPA: hypothetical protein PK971_05845 [Saprospiraceae bacterium]|nr:hypothetical protein [Saprospiraceae bacterium]